MAGIMTLERRHFWKGAAGTGGRKVACKNHDLGWKNRLSSLSALSEGSKQEWRKLSLAVLSLSWNKVKM